MNIINVFIKIDRFVRFVTVRPMKVEILTSNQPLSADRKYELPCQAYGSRPPAKITWWMDSKELLPITFNQTQEVSDTET